MTEYDTENDRLEADYGGRRKTIYQEAKAMHPAALKRHGKTLRECYDALVKTRGEDDHSWKEE